MPPTQSIKRPREDTLTQSSGHHTHELVKNLLGGTAHRDSQGFGRQRLSISSLNTQGVPLFPQMPDQAQCHTILAPYNNEQSHEPPVKVFHNGLWCLRVQGMVNPHIYPGTQIFRYDHMPATGQTDQNQSMGSIGPRPMGWVPIPLPSMHYQQPPMYCNQPVNMQPVCRTGPNSVPHHLVHQHMGFSGGRGAMNDPQQGQASGDILLAAPDLQNLDPRLLVDSDQQIRTAIGDEEINTTHQRIARAILQQEFSKNAGTTGTSASLERLSPELTPPIQSPETKSPSISRAEAIIKDIDAAGGFEAWLSAGTPSSPPSSDGEGGGATPPEAPDSEEQENEADQALTAMVAADLAAAMTPGSAFGPNSDANFNNFCKDCFELMDSAL